MQYEYEHTFQVKGSNNTSLLIPFIYSQIIYNFQSFLSHKTNTRVVQNWPSYNLVTLFCSPSSLFFRIIEHTVLQLVIVLHLNSLSCFIHLIIIIDSSSLSHVQSKISSYKSYNNHDLISILFHVFENTNNTMLHSLIFTILLRDSVCSKTSSSSSSSFLLAW